MVPFDTPIKEPLYVVAVYSNPVRYASRHRLFVDFCRRMEATPGVQLVLVELAFGQRPFVVTEPGNRWHLQLRAGAESEVWVKESLVNIGVRHLYGQAPDWKYMAWVDADVSFVREDWAIETVQQLQHFRIVQPWSHAIDLGPTEGPASEVIHESLCYAYWKDPTIKPKHYYGHKRHPGYAWAMRRKTWEDLGGLMSWLPMGSADFFMAWGFVGKMRDVLTARPRASGYAAKLLDFQEACDRHVLADVGHVDGLLHHHWHGRKKQRFYVEREQTLRQVGFDPARDVKLNHQGVLVLTCANLALRDALRKYFRSRNEDSSDLE